IAGTFIVSAILFSGKKQEKSLAEFLPFGFQLSMSRESDFYNLAVNVLSRHLASQYLDLINFNFLVCL
ncbi:MAG: hypothetical protein AAFV07_16190, partial [Bacteroidota bacterium]